MSLLLTAALEQKHEVSGLNDKAESSCGLAASCKRRQVFSPSTTATLPRHSGPPGRQAQKMPGPDEGPLFSGEIQYTRLQSLVHGQWHDSTKNNMKVVQAIKSTLAGKH